MRNNLTEKRIFWKNFEDRKLLINSLKKDEIAITSTDTVYGFLGSVSSQSYDRICALKNCPKKRPFIILIGLPTKSSLAETLSRFIDVESVSGRKVELLARCWPGPLTVIFKAKPGLPDHMVSSEKTVALRCPDHTGLQAILPKFDGLFSTSANISGEPVPERFEDISPELVEQVSFVVDDQDAVSAVVAKSKPSSIIDFSESKDLWRVVRQGAYSLEKLEEIYEQTR